MARVDQKGIADAKEPERLKDGVHNLQILSAKHEPGKKTGRMRTEVMLVCPEEPDTQAVFHYLTIPREEEDYLSENPGKGPADHKKSEKFKSLNNKRFLIQFDIPFDNKGFETEDFSGKTAPVRTQIEVDDQDRKSVKLLLNEIPG